MTVVLGRAGPACCCTRRSATASRATSTARARRPSRAGSASGGRQGRDRGRRRHAADRRGSLNIDDEGNPTQCTTLIEDGILKGYIQDTLNARLMKMPVTGNARRESYAALPMPRMTNTYMLNGDKDPQEIIASVKNGLYAVNFGGGQVDITNGKFVFSASEAYMIENGKITYPVKGATLIGSGPESLKYVSMIGNDMRSIRAWASAARKARACRSASASRRCASTR
jgi:predicted Zn-dependent protease